MQTQVRISGTNIPLNKVVHIGLTYIFGIGSTTAKKICNEVGIPDNLRVKDLTDSQVSKIREVIDSSYKVEGDLRTAVAQAIARLKSIKCYRGGRHIKGLPMRARTRTNARTRKGKRK